MDKVDYLIRDVLMAGMQLEQDCRQLIPLVTQHCKVSRTSWGAGCAVYITDVRIHPRPQNPSRLCRIARQVFHMHLPALGCQSTSSLVLLAADLFQNILYVFSSLQCVL